MLPQPVSVRTLVCVVVLPALSVIVCLSVIELVLTFQNHNLADSVERKPCCNSASDIPVAVLTDETVCDMTVWSPLATAPPTVLPPLL